MTIKNYRIACDKCSSTEWDVKGVNYYCRNCGTKMSDEKIEKELKSAYENHKQGNVIKIYKTCFEGCYCAHETLDNAKEMIICDIECDDDFTKEEVEKYKKEINELKEEDLGDKVYQAGPYSLETGEMDEEEFNNLPEFDGY